MFPGTQPPDGPVVASVDYKMKSAEALYGDDRAFFYRRRRIPNGGLTSGDRDAVSIPEFHLRTTFRTCIGLRMESAISRIFVLAAATRAHREVAHGRVRS